MIPADILRRLHKRAELDAMPVAELIRRIIDLAITFKMPPESFRPGASAEMPQKFVAIMPACMVDELAGEAHDRGLQPDELFRQMAIYYLIVRHRVAGTPPSAAA